MLASAGRRYLLSLLNGGAGASSVGLPLVTPLQLQPGCQQLQACLSQLPAHHSFSSSSSSTSSSDNVQQPLHAQHVDPLPHQPQQQQQRDDDADLASFSLAAAPGQQPQPQQQQRTTTTPFPPAAATGPRKVDPALFGGSKGPRTKREGVVHVNSTMNNTHLVLTDRDSRVETWVSGGTVGYKNANKATPMAAELAAKELARRALDKGFHSVVVKLKGMGKNKQFAVQSLAASGLTVTQIWDVTPIPYNGCRLPRRRRV